MNISDNYLEVSQQNERPFESLFKQVFNRFSIDIKYFCIKLINN